jgi:hypothetical protein
MATKKKRSSSAPGSKLLEKLPPKRVMQIVLSVAEVAWSDGGRPASFMTGEQKSAVKKLAAAGYMTIASQDRKEIMGAITTKGHLLLLALRGGA